MPLEKPAWLETGTTGDAILFECEVLDGLGPERLVPKNDGPFGDVAYRICDVLRDLIFHPRVHLHAYTLRMEDPKG